MHVLIIGGGIIGCALARELARRGAAVTLLEARATVGAAASGAAIGTLSYSPSSPMPEGWHALAAPSLAAHHALAAALAEEVAEAPRWQWPGRLSVATTNAAEKSARARLKEDLAAGEGGHWLDKRAIHAAEPGLGGRVQGGSFRPGQGWVDAAHLTRALAEAARHYGATLHHDRPVERLLWEGERVVGAQAGGQRWAAAAVVIAAGAWSGLLAPDLAPPITPVRGQALHLDLSGTRAAVPPLHHLVSGNGIYMIPEGQGVSIGATHEQVGFKRGNTAGGVGKLLGNAIGLLPALAEADWARARLWSGLRPATPDKLPILGPDPDAPGLWWATGHFRSGILLAPLTATRLAAALLEGQAGDARFSVGRFR